MQSTNRWRTPPRRSTVIFLLAVFFIFTGIGIASDVTGGARQPLFQFAVTVLCLGFFAVIYAAAGVMLRGRFWRAFVPIFLLQTATMTLLGNWHPNLKFLSGALPSEAAHLQNRLRFDGLTIMICVGLGYAGFITVSVSEARRYIKMQSEKAALQTEMSAAHEVQRVMVPDDLPAVPGYVLDSVYRPAAEVGGDFFQVVPLLNGNTLVVIGDVSGKGLKAAMIVSMIVGMLYVVSSFTEEPEEILTELNRRLCGRTQGGFVTCLVVRLEERGAMKLANAGHPAPYLNGIELPLHGSLPLGISAGAVYEQAALQMRGGDVAVLMTDGIAEAQNAERVLLGFPRVEAMLREGASVRIVAEAAQLHGQNDDLTVISIARAAE
jgi:Stage II sporulation protein E (SpoIIE)